MSPSPQGPEMFPFLWSTLLGALLAFLGHRGRSRVSGWEAHGGGRGFCVHHSSLRACGPSLPALPPQAASLCPLHLHALPRPCHYLLGPLTRPEPGTRRCCWSRERLALRAWHPEAQDGGCGQLGSRFLLTALGEKKDLKNVFFLVYQLSPAQSGGVRGSHCLWPLQAGFTFCCWQNEGRGQVEPQSAGLRLCFQPPYHLASAGEASCRGSFGSRSSKASPAGLPGDKGRLGRTDCVQRATPPRAHLPRRLIPRPRVRRPALQATFRSSFVFRKL